MLDRPVEIAKVFFGQRGGGEDRIRQIDSLVRRDQTAGSAGTSYRFAIARSHQQTDQPVIDINSLTFRDFIHKRWITDRKGFRRAIGRAADESNRIAAFEFNPRSRDLMQANLRTAQVAENRDRLLVPIGPLPHGGETALMIFVATVAEIEPTDIDPGLEHSGQTLRIGGGRTECRDNFGPDQSAVISNLHGRFLERRVSIEPSGRVLPSRGRIRLLQMQSVFPPVGLSFVNSGRLK